MTSNLDRHRADLERLASLADDMRGDILLQSVETSRALNEKEKAAKKRVGGAFAKYYQSWYTEAHAVIRQLIPDRLAEFEELYRGDGRRKGLDVTTYTIQDWLTGTRSANDVYGKKIFDDLGAAGMRFFTQHQILEAAGSRFDSSLHDIRQILQADLFDSELDAARELLKNGFSRAAGAIAGVVLERHLGQVAENHQLKVRKKRPSIADWNDALKSGAILDVPTWRFVQRLGDLRNLCDHAGARPPTDEEVLELVDGVEKTIKTLY